MKKATKKNQVIKYTTLAFLSLLFKITEAQSSSNAYIDVEENTSTALANLNLQKDKGNLHITNRGTIIAMKSQPDCNGYIVLSNELLNAPSVLQIYKRDALGINNEIWIQNNPAIQFCDDIDQLQTTLHIVNTNNNTLPIGVFIDLNNHNVGISNIENLTSYQSQFYPIAVVITNSGESSNTLSLKGRFISQTVNDTIYLQNKVKLSYEYDEALPQRIVQKPGSILKRTTNGMLPPITIADII